MELKLEFDTKFKSKIGSLSVGESGLLMSGLLSDIWLSIWLVVNELLVSSINDSECEEIVSSAKTDWVTKKEEAIKTEAVIDFIFLIL